MLENNEAGTRNGSLFNALFSEAAGVIELRAIDKTTGQLIRLFSRDHDERSEWIERNTGQYNLYFGLSTRKPGSKSGTKADCYEIATYWADLDFKDYPGGEQEAREALRQFPLQPSAIVASGGGLHVYWIFRELEFLDGNIAIHEARMRGIAKVLRADHTFDVSRVFRIPGTTNYPNAKKLAAGRTEAPCVLEFLGDARYNPDDFDIFADAIVESVERPQVELSGAIPPRFQTDLNRDQYFREVWEGVQIICKAGTQQVDRSRQDSRLTHRLVKLGYGDDEIAAVLLAYKLGKAHEQKNAEGYISGVIADAREHLSRDPTMTETSMSSHYNIDNGGMEVLNVIHLTDHDEPSPQEYIVEDLLPKNHIAIAYGDGGNCKTYTAMGLAACVAQGVPFCGQSTKKTNVLYLDWELNADDHLRRAYAVARGQALEKPPEGIFYASANATLYALMPSIQQLIVEKGIELVVIDSMGLAAGVDTESAKEIIGLFSKLKTLGVTILALDHQAKAQDKQRYENKTPFGSAYKYNLARVVYQLKRTESPLDGDDSVYLVLRNTKSNFSKTGKTFSVKIGFGGKAVSFEQHTVLECETADGSTLILNALSEGGEMTAQEIADATKVVRGTVTNLLGDLKESGMVRIVGKKRNAPIYGLPEATIEDSDPAVLLDF
ncbi:MAG: hypothetical protein COV45_06000 [Deltaproteobacteria bacterium CG11_big_fil_rev_8_21_14_0_20_47_16]|nr:MAG: hypothetical protein COV45_06000 [Deltaproteobacteria bacterium CG11_big_fil_rev_8_21_14_0_20_47_16]